METVRSVSELRAVTARWRREEQTIGYVPTMGYLHPGHVSLVETSRRRCRRTIASIFVNPTQFGPNEDYEKYPRDLDRDSATLQSAGCDLLWNPGVEDIYPVGTSTVVEVLGLQDGLCGRNRPGHFRGVATVVTKLFNAVLPDVAFFGQKDAQQAAIIRRMTRDLLFPIEIVVCPTARETDGLAMSSRNSYLTPEERAQAPALYRGLTRAERQYRDGERRVQTLVEAIQSEVRRAGLAQIDYIEIVDADTLQPIEQIRRPALAALAVRVGKARLIDNITLG